MPLGLPALTGAVIWGCDEPGLRQTRLPGRLAMKTGLKVFVRLTGVLTGLLGLCLFYVSLYPLLIARMFFTGNGPGGHSDVNSAAIWSGVGYSFLAMVVIATGLFCEWWTFQVWRRK